MNISHNRTFKPFLLISIILIIPLVFFGTLTDMVHVWTVNETFTHGFLIFPISLWLIWQKKSDIYSLNIRPEPKLFILLLPIVFIWYISSIIDVQIIQQFMLITLILITSWLVLGRQIVFLFLFPLLFLQLLKTKLEMQLLKKSLKMRFHLPKREQVKR